MGGLEELVVELSREVRVREVRVDGDMSRSESEHGRRQPSEEREGRDG